MLPDASKSVLAIDDNEEILLLVRVLLERAGFSVDTVSTREDALQKLLARRYAVIVLDWKMPHNGGLFIEHLRVNFPGFLTRVIILTAVNPSSIPEEIRSSICSVVQKPFELDQLVDLITECAAKNGVSPSVH